MRLSSCFFCLVTLFWLPQAANAEQPRMQIAIDATDLPRKLLNAELRIPLADADRTDDTVALWYPKWVPGSHGPGGPIANVAGILVKDSDGNLLKWRRAVGEFHQLLVEVPEEVTSLVVNVRYITNQPTTTSNGHDSFGSALVGVISPSSVLFYPGSANIDEMQIEASLELPKTWQHASALPVEETSSGDEVIHAHQVKFATTALRTFVDSPIMCGRYYRKYELSESSDIPPHRLHVFSEDESALDIHAGMQQRLTAMVTQASRLFGSHPFDQFDILLATTDVLPKNGLEHSRSTFNVLGQRSMQDPNNLKGWDRLLVPHEYIHAWCGKYRRPEGMVTSDYHSAKATELLWVYEGLTQYLGELVEARAGWMDEKEFKQRFEIEVRAALHQQGRQWRSLADTGACSHTLRAGSTYWPRLRRSQDYYMEGMLFWIEADAIIRDKTDGKQSLDDFCQLFFKSDGKPTGPVGYDRADIVTALGEIVPHDWDGLILRRIESTAERFDPAVVDVAGYSIQYSNEKPDIPRNVFRRVGGVDAIDSLGAVFGADGSINDVLLGSPLYASSLGPGMKVMGVNGHKWSENRMRDAIALSATKGFVELMVVSGDSFETHRVTYDDGPRFMTLVKKNGAKDWLKEMVKPR